MGGNFIHDREDVQDFITPSNSFIKFVENWGIFAQETFRSGPFSVIPSGRYDKNSQFGDTANPRVQAMVDATDFLRFSGAAGRSFRAPSIDDVTPQPGFNYLGNPDLKPETAWTYDAGFELHKSSVSLQATYFRANISNLIQTFVQQDPNDPLSPYVAVNLGKARRQGAEVTYRQGFNEHIRHQLNYTFLENLAVLPGSTEFVPLAYSPRHTANYVATLVAFKRWTLDNTLSFQDYRYNGNNHTGSKMGSQLLWDVRLAYQLRQLEIFLGAHNLTNKRYVENPGYPLPGATFFGGVTLKLWE